MKQTERTVVKKLYELIAEAEVSDLMHLDKRKSLRVADTRKLLSDILVRKF